MQHVSLSSHTSQSINPIALAHIAINPRQHIAIHLLLLSCTTTTINHNFPTNTSYTSKMLHDAAIHLGLTSGTELGRRVHCKQQNARKKRYFELVSSLQCRGRSHGFPGCDQLVPSNILHELLYMWDCYQWKCEFIGGLRAVDFRHMDLGIAADDPHRNQKVTKRFREYLITGGCQVCQKDTEDTCYNQEDEENDDSAGV